MKLEPPWRIEVHPLTFGRARIVVTDGFSIAEFW